MSAWAFIENIVTLVVIATIIVGVWALGGGPWGLWALVLMLNLNGPRSGGQS